ncbi:MAG: glycerophosphodiester phosphodiesterase family protein [Mariprofundus sp.]
MMRNGKPADYLVAHRGDRTGGGENTLAAFACAVSAGARYAECDIQFTRDNIPVVIHDNNLTRLCDRPYTAVSASELSLLQQACSDHFTLSTLNELLLWLPQQPQLTMFIEIKPDIRARLNEAAIADLLASHIPIREQVVLISESGHILDACKARFACRTGWVAEGNERPESPLDYVFMPFSEADTIAVWHARGVQVGLYTINDATLATAMLITGADLIETDHYSRMLAEMNHG